MEELLLWGIVLLFMGLGFRVMGSLDKALDRLRVCPLQDGPEDAEPLPQAPDPCRSNRIA